MTCKDCKHLMFSDCYGECAAAYNGIVQPWDTCEHWKEKTEKRMTNAEKLAKDTDLMATMVNLYCKTQHDCTKCVLAENQCCVLNTHVNIVDFLESEVKEDAEIH